MKNIFCLSLCVHFVSAAFPQSSIDPTTDLAVSPIKNSSAVIQGNRIRKELIYSYTFSDDKITDSVEWGSVEYDSLGNIVRTVEFANFPNLTMTKTYYYQRPHRLVRMLEDHEYPEPHTYITEYAYDSAGNQILSFCHTIDMSFFDVNRRVFDTNNQLLASYRKKQEDSFHLEVKYYYSENAELFKEENYNATGKLNSTTLYTIDSAAHKKTIFYDNLKGDQPERREVIIFDSHDRCITDSTWNRYTNSLSDLRKNIQQQKLIVEPGAAVYTYNPNGTLFQWVSFFRNKQEKITRHYYFTK
jgi:hypothetical protein